MWLVLVSSSSWPWIVITSYSIHYTKLYDLIYADGVLDKYEDYLVRQLAKLLRLSHGEMIEAKVKVLDELRPMRAARLPARD